MRHSTFGAVFHLFNTLCVEFSCQYVLVIVNQNSLLPPHFLYYYFIDCSQADTIVTVSYGKCHLVVAVKFISTSISGNTYFSQLNLVTLSPTTSHFIAIRISITIW